MVTLAKGMFYLTLKVPFLWIRQYVKDGVAAETKLKHPDLHFKPAKRRLFECLLHHDASLWEKHQGNILVANPLLVFLHGLSKLTFKLMSSSVPFVFV